MVMVAFDLLYLNGYDLRKLPSVERVGTRAQRGRRIKPDGSCALADDYSAGIEPFCLMLAHVWRRTRDAETGAVTAR
jgi:hypothetical protein